MTVSSATATDYGTTMADKLNGSSGKSTATTEADDLQDRFLSVLMAQLQNQDPMNPMDNAEMTSQLAQISTVQGITTLNSTMDTMAAAFSSGQMVQAANLIGHQVMAEGKTLTLSGGQAIGGINLASAADAVTVKVFDSTGTQVDTLELGNTSAGMSNFSWDGTDANGNALAEGAYTFTVAASKEGSEVKATQYALSQVASVVSGTSGLQVQLLTGASVTLSQIQTVF